MPPVRIPVVCSSMRAIIMRMMKVPIMVMVRVVMVSSGVMVRSSNFVATIMTCCGVVISSLSCVAVSI